MSGLEEIQRDGEEYDKVTLNPRYRFIPFAFTAGGDYYCFVYEESQEPFVICLFHDDFDYQFYGKDYDEFLYAMMLDSAASLFWDGREYKKDKAWTAHLDYISDEYRSLLEASDFPDQAAAEEAALSIIDQERPEIWVGI